MVAASPQQKGTRWSITFWMTKNTGFTKDTLNEFTQKMPEKWKLEGQEEKGSGEDHHYQLMLWTGDQRCSAVMKIFPQCHIEVAKNQFALQNYVHKAETRIGEFKTIENKSPQWHIIVAKFAEWLIQTDNQDVRDDDRKMRLWDEFIIESLKDGMRVDIVGVNPQYRLCIKTYWSAYVYLAIERLSNPPPLTTDRQTDSTCSSPPPLK